jgi:colanic acid/amylovoran biosynthesis glycosyltransferase
MIGDLPFPHDWANAAGIAVPVSKIASGQSNSPDVFARRRLRLKPSRYFWRMNDRMTAAALVAALRQAERETERVSVLHGHFASAARPLLHVARRCSTGLVVTEHFTGATNRASPGKRRDEAGWARAQSLYASADRVVAVSQYLADSIIEHTGVEATVIGNPIDVELFSVGSPTGGPPIALFVGRLEHEKRPELLLRGLAHPFCPHDLQLVVIGDGPLRGAIERLAGELHISQRVTITGRLPRAQVAAWSRRATLGISTSFVETFGVAVAEMAAAGLPVVAPDISPFDEVLPPHGYIPFQEGSAEALALALSHAISNAWDRRSIRQSIVDRFSPSVVGEQLRTLYESL